MALNPLSQNSLSKRERAVEHWQRVMRTPGLPSISYESAEEALKKLGVYEREPGEDDQ